MSVAHSGCWSKTTIFNSESAIISDFMQYYGLHVAMNPKRKSPNLGIPLNSKIVVCFSSLFWFSRLQFHSFGPLLPLWFHNLGLVKLPAQQQTTQK